MPPYLVPFFFLALGAILLRLNLHIHTHPFSKAASYIGMWLALISSVVTVVLLLR